MSASNENSARMSRMSSKWDFVLPKKIFSRSKAMRLGPLSFSISGKCSAMFSPLTSVARRKGRCGSSSPASRLA